MIYRIRHWLALELLSLAASLLPDRDDAVSLLQHLYKWNDEMMQRLIDKQHTDIHAVLQATSGITDLAKGTK